jgi:hypothetical protein
MAHWYVAASLTQWTWLVRLEQPSPYFYSMADIGRPTVMTAERIAVLEQAFLNGATDEQACFIAGTVAAYVRQEAVAYGVNPTDALWIVSHESQDGQNMRGDDGQSRGYWMISDIWHPEVSTACADDLPCSTAWSLKWIFAGNISQWSTWACRYALYPEATSTLGSAPEDYKKPNYCK